MLIVMKHLLNYSVKYFSNKIKNKRFVLFKLGRKRVRAFGMLKDLTKHMSDPDKQ
jgi:hypothetical protein